MSSRVRSESSGSPRLLNSVSVVVALLVTRLVAEVFPSTRGTIILLGIACLFFEGTHKTEKTLALLVGYVGITPALAWVSNAMRIVDPAVLVAGISIGMTLRVPVKAWRPNGTLVTAAVPAILTFGYWHSMFTGGPVNAMKRLLLGWDHFGHFDLFMSLRATGVYKIVSLHEPQSGALFNERYPAGLHAVWASFWRFGGLDTSRVNLLTEYGQVVIISFAISIGVIAYSFLRLKSPRRHGVLVPIGVLLLVLPAFGFGHYSMGVWGGFPNYTAAIAGAVVAASVSVRPLKSALAQNVVLIGVILFTSYNWYPIAIAVTGILALEFHRQWRSSTLRGKWMLTCAYVAGLTLAAVPVVLTLKFGASHLTLDGGFPGPTPNTVVELLLGPAAGVICLNSFTRTKRTLEILLSPAVLGLIGSIILSLYIRIASGGYPYYQKKIVFAFALVGLGDVICQLVRSMSSRTTEVGRKRALAVSLGLILAILAFVQTLGYWGPDWRVFAPQSVASGIGMKAVAGEQIERFGRPAQILVALDKKFEGASRRTRSCLVIADLDKQDYDPVLTNYWLGAVLNDVTEARILRSQKLVTFITNTNNPEENAWAIENTLNVKQDCAVVGPVLRKWLIAVNSVWATRTVILNNDLSVTVPPEFSP